MNDPREPFEMEAALRAAEGSRELVQEIASILLGQLPAAIASMQAAVAAHDGPALKRLAHQLSGSLGLFGAQPALEAARALEAAADSDWPGVPAHWSRFEAEAERLRRALADCLAGS